jgi:protocatechuate 3,4-dioxygenase beta subunit
MNRKEFLKGIGLVSVGVALPTVGLGSVKDMMDEPSNNDLLSSSCTIIPGETAGPYPAPSTISTSSLLRSNITEGTQTGIPLSLTLTVLNSANNCLAVSGLRVDIWHCNKRGYYSAYDGQPGIDGTVNNAGSTWLRGIQYTDSNGQVSFTTIYPGWYTPRATHIHIQIYDSSNNLLATSQLAFPDAINSTVNSYYATSGANSFTNTNDMVFSDSYADELMTVTGNTTNGYVATKQIVVNAGALGVDNFDLQSGGQFTRLENYPNPSELETTISFNLIQTSDVEITIFDLGGKLIQNIVLKDLSAGKNEIKIDTSKYQSGEYIYQFQVANLSGVFRKNKKFIRL